MKIKHLFIISALVFSYAGTCEAEQMDSLKQTWSSESLSDSIRSGALSLIISNYMPRDIDSAKYYIDLLFNFSKEKHNQLYEVKALKAMGQFHFEKGDFIEALSSYRRALNIALDQGFKIEQANVLNGIGSINFNQGNLDAAKTDLARALEIGRDLNDSELIASTQTTLGNVANVQGDHVNAIKYYTSSLSIYEELGEHERMAKILSNVAIIYAKQADNDKALEYMNRALKLNQDVENERGVSHALINLGILHRIMGKPDEAMDYYQQSLEICIKNGDAQNEAAVLTNMALLYRMQGKHDEAINLINRSIEVYESSNNRMGMSNALDNLNSVYFEMGNYQKSIECSKRSLQIAEEIGAIDQIRNANKALYLTYKKLGKTTDALKMYEKYIAISDSILDEENQREVLRQEFKYTYEKEALKDSIQSAEAKKVLDAQINAQQAQLREEATQRYSLIGGLALLALFGVFMFNRYRVTNKQKAVIEVQKQEVEEAHEQLTEKNKEITDSIQYAKRIQTAILPPDRIVREYLANSFILYMPKDVVAGDFYWMEPIGDTVYFAAADCTGHGVPGAMVSVICNGGLNRSVREFGLRDPGEILDKTRELVISEFEKSEEEVKDGMDISLCALNLKTNTITWSGANNPIWIVRKDSPEIEEIKANKQPIGKYALSEPFTSHTINLNSGDMIYIFSDGYPDQFGGANGKKYKSGKFKKTLVRLSREGLLEQRKMLHDEFETWRGDNEQIDDVCVIGVKIS